MRPFIACVVLFCALFLPSSVRAQIDYPGFNSIVGLKLVDNAQQAGGALRLNNAQPYSGGACWYVTKQMIETGFITEFQFQISDTAGELDFNDQAGGDGFAFVIQNESDTTIGSYGGGLGYDGIYNSLAIEFDTWNNGRLVNDPDNNHISVQCVGRTFNTSAHSASLGRTSNIRDLSDHGIHTVMIEYLPGKLQIYLDRCTPPVLTVNVDLADKLLLDSGRAWVGFTGATGSAWETHDILTWNFHSTGIIAGEGDLRCLKDSLLLTGPPGFARYIWSTGEETRSITVHKSGTYYLQLPFNACSQQYTEVSYTVLPQPSPRVEIDGTLPLCEGEGVRLSLNAKFDSYRWSTGATTPTIVATQAGQYWATVTDSNGCSGESDRLTVTVLPAPRPTISPSGIIERCIGEQVELDAGTGYRAYRWSTGEQTRRITVAQAGLYTVTVTDSNGCEGTSPPVTVRFRTSLSPRITPSGTVVLCQGDTTTLDAGDGYASYLWSTGDDTRVLRVATAGQYWVDVTGAAGCSGRSDTVTVLEVLPPYPTISPEGSATICAGDSLLLEAGEGYVSYRWSTGDTTRSIFVKEEGTYDVEVTDRNGCRGRSSIVGVNVRTVEPPVVVADGPLTLCNGASRRLSAPPGYVGYLWSTGETTESIQARGEGAYAVTVTDANGCRVTSAPIELTIRTAPPADAGKDMEICPGGNAPLHASGGVTYLWQPSDGLSCDDCADPIASPDETTVYTVTVTDADGCSADDAMTVTVLPAVAANAHIPNDLHVVPGSSVTVPIVLDDPLDAMGITEIEIGVLYHTGILRLLDAVTTATRTDGWSLTPIESTPGIYRARLTAPSGGSLQGTGDLLRLLFKGFLGDSSESDIQFTASVTGTSCTRIVARAGHIRIDSVCGLSLRLIESTAEQYALGGNRPNPFNPTTEISFSIGLDGPTWLEVFDAAGHRVATLVDEYMKPGKYVVTWDASDQPSGVYYYRLRSGDWTQSGVMTLAK